MKFMDKIISHNSFADFSSPIDTRNPSGINIEYDTRFVQLQQLMEGKAEQQYGDTIIPAEEPDWKKIKKLCVQLLSESKDIHVLCFYIQVLTAQYGVEGFSHGCKMLLMNLENYWDSIYPSLFDEEEFDPFYRINALSALIAREGVIKQLNKAVLKFSTDTRISITVKEAVDVLSTDNKGLYPGGESQLIMDMRVAGSRGNEYVNHLKESRECIEKLDMLFQDKLPDEVIDFSILTAPLNIFSLYGDFSDDSKKKGSVKRQTTKNPNKEINTFMNISAIKITNRKEVDILLEKVSLYFATYEPSHPAPLFIKRAQRTMDMNFYEIMQDVSPQSLSEVDNLFGKLFEKDKEN